MPGDAGPERPPGGGDASTVVDARGAVERRVRRAWRDRPGPGLRAASFAYGAGVGAWSFLWEAGLLAPEAVAVPVVSVGGITVGGSGKTPLASALADMLDEGGLPAAVVTRGFPDELSLHARLAPGRVVVGHPDRARAAREAVARGARAVVLDDGFQHRRLARSLDVVVLDADFAGRGDWSLLPAGPFREPPSALGRADRLVVARREAGEEAGRRLAAWARRRIPGVPVARCALAPGGLVRWEGPGDAGTAKGIRPRAAAPERAPGGGPGAASPSVAVAGVMKPRPFFEALRAANLAPRLTVVLPDHGAPTASLLERIVGEGRGGGVVTTAKDAVRLAGDLPADLPVWILEERLTWEEGEDELRAGLMATVRRGAGRTSPAIPTTGTGQ